jgi:twinkle protein
MNIDTIQSLSSGIIEDRKIRADVVERFNVKLEYNPANGEVVKHYYPITKNGVTTAYKARELPKTFASVGDAKGKVDLFGQAVTPKGGKKLLIVGGELDCLAAYQMLITKYPNFPPSVVSLPKGENVSSVKDNIDFVNSFQEVLIYTDMDTVGRTTADNIAKLIGVKAKIVSTSEKDASDMLVAGKSAEFINAFFNAEGRKPEGIVAGKDVSIERLKKPTQHGFKTQYTALNKMIGGLRKGELTTLTAGSGIGKSTLSREIGYHLRAVHGLTIGHIALEEKIEKTINGYIAIDNNLPLNKLMEYPTLLNDLQWENSYNKLIATGWNGFDHFGSMPVEDMMDKMRYLAYGEGCDFIILDHLSLVFSGQDSDNERKMIDLAMTQLAAFAVESGVGLLVVVHLSRKPGKTSFNEGGQISLTDLRGSAALEQLSFNVIALERSQQADSEEERNTSQIRVLKCRETGITGLADTCLYDFNTGRLLPNVVDTIGDY